MDKEKLKITYNKMVYTQKELRIIDWSNPNQKDIEFNSAIQNKISNWKNSLSTEELKYLKKFEVEKHYRTNINKLRNQSRELVDNYVRVEYHFGGWYVFSPTAHKNYNRHDEVKIQGKKRLVDKLKEYGKWSFLGNEVIGF